MLSRTHTLHRTARRGLSTAARIFKSPHADVQLPLQTSWELLQSATKGREERVALVCGLTHEKMTYNDFIINTQKVAASLLERGVQKGDVIATNAVNCVEYPIIFHAATAIGAIMSPASPQFRGAELAVQLKAAKAKFLITHTSVQDAAKEAMEFYPIPLDHLFCIGKSDQYQSFEALLKTSNLHTWQVPVDLKNDVSYLPFSSGTTGPPKGVKLSYFNLAANAMQTSILDDLTGHTVSVLPYFHIYGTMLMNVSLLQGGAQVVMPKFDPPTFLGNMERYRVRLNHIVPPIAAFIAKHPLVDDYDLSATKFLVSAAAPMGEGLEGAIKKRLGITVKQAYGMTELSPVANYSQDHNAKNGSIGTTIPNTELRVVCPFQEKDVDVREVGELWYRGPQTMLGYLDNEEATKATLTPCGFVRTGDMGYVDEEGHVFIVDRLKELIKYKGHQIAPAELEDVILTHPMVSDAGCIRGVGREDNDALICGVTHEATTFGSFVNKVERIATSLAALGVKKGDVIGTNVVNCVEYPLFCHAATALGAIMSPASPQFLGTELAAQMRAANAKYFITHHTVQASAVAAMDEYTIPLEHQFCVGPSTHFQSFDDLLKVDSINIPKVDIDVLNDVNFLPFSSGTTGPPKGVRLSFGGLTSNIVQASSVDRMGKHAIMVLPYFHIYATFMMNWAMLQGSAQVILPKFDPETFLHCLERYKVEKAHLVPPLVAFLAKHPLVDKYDLSATKHVISGAAPMGEELEQQLEARLGMKIKQGFGMTELSPVGALPLDGHAKAGSVGPLLPNTELRIVCPVENKDCDIDTPGELWYRGPQTMLGYLNNEEATKATLTEDGWVKTGDIGLIDKDGHIFVVDRLKELIKYKGHQIAPAELEDVIMSHPKVVDVGCIRGRDDAGEEIPRACVVVKPNEELTAAELIEYVSERVAPFKRVREVVFVPAIPKSPSGKIIRRLLQLEYGATFR
ncbi:4-coumarate-CoA ligase [Achlya hypogyna]|uniref:4-coumarate-CoA ligase n=1 Tax=Achlya hypogyna TaxID=1202772 RepID=A0A1V9YHJ2_ACHHY|nr:4-coumarate-CoA ligase [Achlya hypogyna]